MNPWTWTGRDPYTTTPFQVLDLDPAADHATARTRIAARRKRISYDAARFPLFGATLSAADVNAAEERIATPDGRIAAELVTHPREAEGADLPELTELLGLHREWSGRAADPGPAPEQDAASWLDPGVLPQLLPEPGPLGPTSGRTA